MKRADFQTTDLSRYAVGGDEDEWAESLSEKCSKNPSIVSIK